MYQGLGVAARLIAFGFAIIQLNKLVNLLSSHFRNSFDPHLLPPATALIAVNLNWGVGGVTEQQQIRRGIFS